MQNRIFLLAAAISARWAAGSSHMAGSILLALNNYMWSKYLCVLAYHQGCRLKNFSIGQYLHHTFPLKPPDSDTITPPFVICCTPRVLYSMIYVNDKQLLLHTWVVIYVHAFHCVVNIENQAHLGMSMLKRAAHMPIMVLQLGLGVL